MLVTFFFSFLLPFLLLLLLPFPSSCRSSLLLLPSLLFLALPPSLLPPALLGLYWEKALPFLHTLISSSSLTLPSSSLDTLFLHRLLLPHPHLALASAVFLWKVYFPLRWWAFRSLHINGTAAVVIATYLALNLMAKWRKLDDKEAKALYAKADTWLAPWVCRRFVSLRSVFVKFGQYIGGRTDMVPPDWASSLSLLHDQLPPCPPSYVRQAITVQFKKSFSTLFSSFDFSPLASASVAQVHRATLRGSGQEVVVKVQHQGIEALMNNDMKAAVRVFRLVAFLNRDFELLLYILKSWAEEIEKELDFRVEASNLERVRENLVVRGGLDVILPQPVEGLVGKRAFAMDYIEGFKITDTAKLALHRVDREALMARVCQAYNHQFFVDGFFNADPHAGNLMVSIQDGICRPVLLDFGMTVQVTTARRKGYCRLVFQASSLDVLGAGHALKAVGYTNSQSASHPERDVEFFQFLMRDTGTRASQREDADEYFKKRKEQKLVDKAEGVDPNRYMKEVPPEMFFLFRMLGLIRGLCTTLEVKLPYLEIMADYAQKGLVLGYDRKLRATRLLSLPARPPLPLEVKLQRLLLSLCGSRKLLGVQVVLVRRGQMILNLAGGVRGATDPRPVDESTLFPILDLGNVLTALLLHVYMREGVARRGYETPLATLLPPALARVVPEAVRLKHLFSHSTGLPVGLPSSLLPSTLLNHEACLKLLAASFASASPLHPPGTKASQSLLDFGHLAAALLQETCNIPPPSLPQAFYDKVLRPLDLTGEVFLGGFKQGVNGNARSLAVVHNGFAAQLRPLMAMMGGGGGGAGGAINEGVEEGSEEGKEGDKEDTSRPSSASMMERVLRHPTMVNEPTTQAGVCPSLNALATARGLVFVMEALNGGTKLLSRRQQGLLRLVLARESCPLYGERQWGLGMQIGGDGVLGHEAFGGSACLLFPLVQCSLAITTNNLSLDKAGTREVVRVVCREVGLPMPSFMSEAAEV